MLLPPCPERYRQLQSQKNSGSPKCCCISTETDRMLLLPTLVMFSPRHQIVLFASPLASENWLLQLQCTVFLFVCFVFYLEPREEPTDVWSTQARSTPGCRFLPPKSPSKVTLAPPFCDTHPDRSELLKWMLFRLNWGDPDMLFKEKRNEKSQESWSYSSWGPFTEAVKLNTASFNIFPLHVSLGYCSFIMPIYLWEFERRVLMSSQHNHQSTAPGIRRKQEQIDCQEAWRLTQTQQSYRKLFCKVFLT